MANDNHANYARIGFTIVIGVLAIAGTLVYLGGLHGRGNEILLETVYDKPVSGLAVGSVVNFRGVKMGEVREISFIGNKYDVEGAENSRIYILMAVKLDPVDDMRSIEDARKVVQTLVDKYGLRASVVSSGITGLSRIECNYIRPEERSDYRPITWTPTNVFVPPQMSLMDNFSDAATKVMNQINKMDISSAWSNLNSAVEALARASEGAKSMIEARQGDLDKLLDDLSETSTSVKGLTSELKRNPSLLIRERIPARLEETE